MIPAKEGERPISTREAFPAAIQAAIQTATTMGASNRAVYTGLWFYSISMLIQECDPEDALAILEESVATATTSGHNFDSPVENLDEAARNFRRMEAGVVAQNLTGYVDPILDQAGEDAPLQFFRFAMQTIQKAWGDQHFRRIVGDQVVSILAGESEVVFPSEPRLLNRERRTREGAVPFAPVALPSSVEPDALPAHRPPASMVSARIDIDVGDEDVVYAVVYESITIDEARRDVRDVVARVGNETGRRTCILAALDLFRAISSHGTVVRIDTSSSLLAGGLGIARLPSETELWNELDGLMRPCTVEWRLEPESMTSVLGERADRLLRMERERDPR